MKSFAKLGLAQLIGLVIYLAILIFNVFIPFGADFLNLLQVSLDTGVWDVMSLVTPIGYLIGYSMLLTVVYYVIMFILFANFANKHNR